MDKREVLKKGLCEDCNVEKITNFAPGVNKFLCVECFKKVQGDI